MNPLYMYGHIKSIDCMMCGFILLSSTLVKGSRLVHGSFAMPVGKESARKLIIFRRVGVDVSVGCMAGTFDGANHGAVAGPLLGVGEVRARIQVRCNEVAARILADAERRVLDLVVVQVPVKAHHHCAHLHSRNK